MNKPRKYTPEVRERAVRMTDRKELKPLAEQALIGEIVLQCKLALRAADHLAGAKGPIEKWGSIQSLLVASANVSKILSPGERHEARGDHLRNLLGVDDRTLRTIRRFRNHFEHYDERIDRWFDDHDSAVYTDLGSDPSGVASRGFPRYTHRNYDPVTRTLSFRNESIDLTTVLEVLAEILEKCRPFALVDWDQ